MQRDQERWAPFEVTTNAGFGPESASRTPPLKLARRKAQYFKSELTDELHRWAQEQRTRIPNANDVIPWVQESVFLHHLNMRCELSPSSAINLYGLDGHERASNLPGISELVHQPTGRRAIGRNQELILTTLMDGRQPLEADPSRCCSCRG